MGKAARKRVRARRDYLARLLESDPERFADAWSKRLRSWANETLLKRLAGTLVDENGRHLPSVFVLVEQALRELSAIGDHAFRLESEATRTFLTEECSKAVAKVADYRLHPTLVAEGRWDRLERL